MLRYRCWRETGKRRKITYCYHLHYLTRLDHALYGPICCNKLLWLIIHTWGSTFKLISLVNSKKVKMKRWFYLTARARGPFCSDICVPEACVLFVVCSLVSLSRSTNSSQKEKYISISLSKWKVFLSVSFSTTYTI